MSKRKYFDEEIKILYDAFTTGTSLFDAAVRIDAHFKDVIRLLRRLSAQNPKKWNPIRVNKYIKEQQALHRKQVAVLRAQRAKPDFSYISDIFTGYKVKKARIVGCELVLTVEGGQADTDIMDVVGVFLHAREKALAYYNADFLVGLNEKNDIVLSPQNNLAKKLLGAYYHTL